MALGDTYKAPWESTFKRVVSPLEDFAHKETASGVLLILATVIALVLANFFAASYQEFFGTYITFEIGSYSQSHSLHHWINDGLMALFFFVVGLEIKREILVGDLSSPSKAVLPMIAAVGGMVVPAAVYYGINPVGENAAGWGIPMATDIAFAVGVLVLLGDRVPRGLLAFLMALAIVDDLGAVVVIAIFYTGDINWVMMQWAGVFLAILIIFNLLGLRSMPFHFAIGFGLWLCMMDTGVHATIAGVLGALTVPGRPPFAVRSFSKHVHGQIDRFDEDISDRTTMTDSQRQVVQSLGVAVRSVESPIRLWEQKMHSLVAFIIIPLFAVANAGVEINPDTLGEVFTHPVTLGVMLGLLVGKVVGIAGFTIIAAKMGIGQLPEGTKHSDFVGIGFLGGIGFTMSIFISELAFKTGDKGHGKGHDDKHCSDATHGAAEAAHGGGNAAVDATHAADALATQAPTLIELAKTGILFASIAAAIGGLVWLATSLRNR